MSRDNALKIALWTIPVLFGFGSLYTTVLGSAAGVDDVETRLEAHEDLKAHPVTEERITQTEDQITEILTEQRAIKGELSEQGRSISAICQATDANCR